MRAKTFKTLLGSIAALCLLIGCPNPLPQNNSQNNPTYTLVYDGNGNTGGSVPVDSNHYTQGQKATVLGNTGNLVKTGYSFSGWNTSVDGSGSTYAEGQTFTMTSSNVTLYAKWIPILPIAGDWEGDNIKFTVSSDGSKITFFKLGPIYFSGGGVSGHITTSWASDTPIVNLAFTESGNPHVEGTFSSSTSASGTYSYHGSIPDGFGGYFYVSSSGSWTALSLAGNPTFTVTYDPNGATGGTVPNDSTQYLSGKTVTVRGNTGSLVKTGYGFSGWNTQADGSGTTYTQGSTFTMGTANVTLYAKWSLPHTVTYDANGATSGSVPVDSANYFQGDTVTVRGNTGSLVRTGYSFSGWNTQTDGNGTTYAQGATFTMGTANITLYADWVAATVLDLSVLAVDTFTNAIQTLWYLVTVTGGQSYTVFWDDLFQGSGAYTADVKVSAFREDQVSPYFTNVDSGYLNPKVVTIPISQTILYIKVVPYSSGSTGTFGLRVGPQ